MVDSRLDTAFPLGWASLCASPQHNVHNPTDLPRRGGRAGAGLASCLAEWLEWVLGLLLIPQRLTVPAGGAEEEGVEGSSSHVSRQEAGRALP